MNIPYPRFYENKSRTYINGKRYRLGNPNHPYYDYYIQHGMDKTLNHMKITGVKRTKHKRLNPSRKGDLAEYYAVTWLWDNGYEVFPNAGCSGPVDMIATKDGKVILIDVKTLHPRGDRQRVDITKGVNLTSGKRSKEQIKAGVKLLGFNPVTRQLRFVEHKDGQSN